LPQFIKRGTLILKEEPQIPKIQIPAKLDNLLSKLEQMSKFCQKTHLDREFKSNAGMKSEFEEFVKNVMSFFHRMSQSYQREYLEFNIAEIDGLKAIITNMEKDSDKAEKILKIVSIYIGHNWNSWPDGTRIKTALFNHSCHPNAAIMKFTAEKGHPLRAISDIEPGQEITFAYSPGSEFLGMRNKEVRQQIILDHCNFTCLCDLCEEDDEPTANQSKIEELIEEVQNLHQAMTMGMAEAIPYIKPGSSLGPPPPSTLFGDSQCR